MTSQESDDPAAARPTSIIGPSHASVSLGPVLSWRRPERSATVRCVAFLVLVGTLTILGIARTLEPDPAGLGTHRRLFGGLPPCTSVVLLGYPCPSCGMTTAFAHTVRGNLYAAFMAQPAGFLLALATAAAAGLSANTLVTGRVLSVNWYRLTPARLACIVVAILLAGWLFKLATGLAAGALPYR